MMKLWNKFRSTLSLAGLVFVVSALFPVYAAKKTDLFLLQTWQHSRNVTGWVMSEKLDGVRAYWNGKQLISRSGLVFKAPVWFTQGFPPFELDGELWTKRNDFENIVSIVRQHQASAQWSQITFRVFEVPNQTGDLMQRLSVLQRYLDALDSDNPDARPQHLRVIEQIEIENETSLKDFFEEVVSAGGEGVVVRNPAAPYQTGRLTQALKMKPFYDTECKVLAHLPGRGKYQGMTGALKCQMSKNRIIRIGSGMTDELRKNPPPVGSLITFKYYGLTKNGLPRFPVYLRQRELR